MKNMVLWVFFLFFVIAVIVFLLGPRAELTVKISAIDLPADLDIYLEKSEAQFTDIIPGTEKIIIWADSIRKEKTLLSIVYLHGYSATRQETKPLCENLAQQLNANIFYTRLTGHGRSNAAMAEATVNDWANDAVEALEIGKQLGERVMIVGTSTGATLAAWLATYDQSNDILAHVWISPNFGPKDRSSEVLNWPWATVYTPLIIGETRTWEPRNKMQAKYWKTSYPTAALFPMMGLVRLVRESELEGIRHPVLSIFSPDDQVVDAEKTKAIFPRIGSETKKIVYVTDSTDPSQHVIAGDILSPNTTEAVAWIIFDFVKSL